MFNWLKKFTEDVTVPDWQKKIDDKERQEKLEEKRRQAERDLESGRRVKEKRLADEQAEQAKLDELGRRFKCHICGRPSTKPFYVPGSSGNNFDDQGSAGYTNWDWPCDLVMCGTCHEWTCLEHIHKGICQKCAEKL
jgi:hypothetical protein